MLEQKKNEGAIYIRWIAGPPCESCGSSTRVSAGSWRGIQFAAVVHLSDCTYDVYLSRDIENKAVDRWHSGKANSAKSAIAEATRRIWFALNKMNF